MARAAISDSQQARLEDALDDETKCPGMYPSALLHPAYRPATIVWNQNERVDRYQTCIRNLATDYTQCHLTTFASLSELDLEPGAHLVSLKGVSLAGRQVTQEQLVIVDDTPPAPGVMRDSVPAWMATWGSIDFAQAYWSAGADNETGIAGYEVVLVKTLPDTYPHTSAPPSPSSEAGGNNNGNNNAMVGKYGDEWLGGAPVASSPRLPCNVFNLTLPVKLEPGGR